MMPIIPVPQFSLLQANKTSQGSCQDRLYIKKFVTIWLVTRGGTEVDKFGDNQRQGREGGYKIAILVVTNF